ncbi:MAG: flippase-like domain-containing protein [Chloroflexota bacterium]
MTTQEGSSSETGTLRSLLPWLNLVLAAVLIIAGIWFLSVRVGLNTIVEVLAAVHVGYVILGVLVMVATIVFKAWRWQLLFVGSDSAVSFSAAFWAVALGQYVNLIVPFLRLGEVARIYSLNREARANAAQTIGTMVVEKVLDLIFFGLTILMVIPYVVLPEQVGDPGILVVLIPLAALVVLYLLAYQTERVVHWLERFAAILPDKLGGWITRVGIAGLEGLSALRSRKLALFLLVLSLVIALLSVLLPYVLFPALDIPLSLIDAAVVHIVVSVVSVPPSTPVKIGVFNGAAAFILWQLGLRDEAIIVSYSILFYLVVIVPQLVLGIIASIRSRWSWNMTLDTPAANPHEPGDPFYPPDKPEISVIVPAYNAEATIDQCVHALVTQEVDRPYEIIVVDDGSTDRTATIAQQAGARVIRTHAAVRLPRATPGLLRPGSIICCTDADCEPTPDWLTQLTLPLQDPQIAACKGTYATRQQSLTARFVQLEYEDKYDLMAQENTIDFIDTYLPPTGKMSGKLWRV